MPKVKGQNRKYPIEFDRAVLPKNIRWLNDYDPKWLQSLGPKEQRFMAKFIREYINGNVRKGDQSALHKTKRLRQDCYTRKNAQNRDLMSILDCGGKMDRIDPDTQTEISNVKIKQAFRYLTSNQRKNAKKRYNWEL